MINWKIRWILCFFNKTIFFSANFKCPFYNSSYGRRNFKIMNSIFLAYNEKNSVDDGDIVAVFSESQLVSEFTKRHSRFYGCYRIEERTIIHFSKERKNGYIWLSLVVKMIAYRYIKLILSRMNFWLFIIQYRNMKMNFTSPSFDM